ncbi:MAG: CDP-alcohol phosphatidyltransferase family protein [Deltaproteobacteria bacterium]|nr:CDP-alcohol phosphatidyltransferase family protein [Deltaproteobacteria bacterium]
MDAAGSVFDSLFALAVLAFILIVGTSSIRNFLRTEGAPEAGGGSLVLGPGIRGWYVAHLQPIEERCIQWGVTPAVLSYTQLAASIVVGYLYARGWLFTGGWLLLTTGSLDIVDGRVARRTSGASKRGAFLDSVIDRYADSAAFIGLAIFFRDSWILWAALLALLGGMMVSYTRARAEGLGAECKVGLLQRPERYVLLGFGTIFGVLFDHIAAPWFAPPPHLLVALAIVVLGLLVNFTAIQRVVHVWRVLGEPDA